MKLLLFLLVTGGLTMIPCTGNAQVASGNRNDKTDTRKTDAIREVYRAIETGNTSRLDSFIAVDFVDHNSNMDGSDIKGRDSLKIMLSQIHNCFEAGLKMELLSDAISADGVYHYAMVRMRGKAKENPWGMPVGMEIDDTSVDVVKYKDGKATDHWGFMSMADFNEIMKSMQQGQPAGEKNE